MSFGVPRSRQRSLFSLSICSDLKSRLTTFYERAGSVRTRAGKRGSLSVVGAIEPANNDDWRDPMTSATLEIVDVFWALDRRLAQRKHFPSVNWLHSRSRCRDALDDWCQRLASDFVALRRQVCERRPVPVFC